MQKTHIYIDVKTRRHVTPTGQFVDRSALFPELERGQWQVLCLEFVSVDEDDAGIVTISPVSFASGHSYLLVADNDFEDDDNLMIKSLQSSTPFDESDHDSNTMQIDGDWIDGTTASMADGKLSVRVNNDTIKFADVMGTSERVSSGLYINVKQYTAGIANPSTIGWLQFVGINTVRDWSSASYNPQPGTETISYVASMLNNSLEFLYASADSADDWHTDMVAQADQYFKIRFNGLDMPWSLPKLIPYGPQGLPGTNGTAATVAVGSVTQGETPSVTNVGTENAAVLNFVLQKGDTGSAGTNGTAATIAVGSVTQGETPSVTNVGTETAAILDFVLVKGDPGSDGVGVPSVTSDDAGKVLTVDSAGLWGASMPAEVTGFVPTSEKGTAFGVAELDSAGKVPASQLPESSGSGPALSNATPAAMGEASPGVSEEASRADHVHPTTGLITRIGHSRPVDAGNLHLQIQTATEPDFSDAVTAIDTYANEGDRAKVLLFDGYGFVAIDEGGAGKFFNWQSVLADVASIEPLQYARLRWFEVLEPMRYLAWEGRYFPASGGGGGASSAAASTTGTLIVNITGDATGGWNIDGSSTWLASGAAISLSPGQYTVFFKRAANVPPNPKPATIYAGAVTEIAGAYSIDAPAGSWIDVAITGPADARWSYNGGLTWIVSGFEVNLLGDYTITFKPVAGYDTPSNQVITAGAFPGDDTYPATYAAAGSGATGYSAYLLIPPAGPELISTQADPTKCVGGDMTLNVINGVLFWDNGRIGADSDWAACSGADIGGTGTFLGYGIKTAGTLHAIDSAGNVSQIGVATNWAAVSGMSGGNCTAYARNSAGEIYALQGNTATRIGSSTTWETVSGFSFLYSTTYKHAAIAIDAGKLIRLDADTPTQIGAATNWAAVGPVFNGVCLAKNDLGELFVVTATLATTAVVQIGAATDWDKLSHVHATNTDGDLYAIDREAATAAQVGVDSNWSALAGASGTSSSYALNTAGELHKITGTTSARVGTASDWMKLDGKGYPIAVRGTAL